MTPNTKNRIHSQFGNLDLIRQFDPGPEVTIHPDDAAARGIEHGDLVKIFNDRGRNRTAGPHRRGHPARLRVGDQRLVGRARAPW